MKNKNLLEVKNLYVSVGEKEILHGVNLSVAADETHVLMGPNGTGKSTLGYAITGNPTYEVTKGEILFDSENITDMPVNERAKKGIFLYVLGVITPRASSLFKSIVCPTLLSLRNFSPKP